MHVLQKLYDITHCLQLWISELNKMVFSERVCDKKRALTIFLHSEKATLVGKLLLR